MKANSPNLFASAVNLIDAAAWIGDHDAEKNIRCRDRISVFIWAARGRMRGPPGGHLLIALGATATGVDAALHIAGPFLGSVSADFDAFPAPNRRLICSTQIFWQRGNEKALTVAG
ncbi:hypothetical protein LZK78_11770 [Rhizobium leguminosarum]|nr:hypothetical protein [Rhizobium leguminosarum]UIJ82174.1 hypothetical protein LZK78_11770 [Rhizobium leguminosarum]